MNKKKMLRINFEQFLKSFCGLIVNQKIKSPRALFANRRARSLFAYFRRDNKTRTIRERTKRRK